MLKSAWNRSFEIYVTGDKFDSMPEAQKLQFKLCPRCGRFYNTDYVDSCKCPKNTAYNGIVRSIKHVEKAISKPLSFVSDALAQYFGSGG